MSGLTQTLKSMVPQRFMPVVKKTVYSLRGAYFSGTNFECPFCGGSFRHMLPFGITANVLKEYKVIGGGYRENCICPRCNSADRERLIYLFLKHQTDLLTNDISVLHIAPEINLSRMLDKPNNFYLSGDLDSPLAMMKMDITKLPFADLSYDLLVCSHVLEHVPDDRKAMSEMFRVLKPGGLAILQTPVSRVINKTIEDFTNLTEEERIIRFGQKDHCRIYAANDYVLRLKSVGFLVEEFDWTLHQEFHPVSNKYSFNPLERLFVCRRAPN